MILLSNEKIVYQKLIKFKFRLFLYIMSEHEIKESKDGLTQYLGIAF